jgi:predicted PurR-regulated permease PerM
MKQCIMCSMKVKIEIDTKTFVRFWLVVIGFVVAGFVIYNAQFALIILGSAFFLALALNSPVSRIAKILPGKSRVGGTAIAYIAVIIVLGIFAFLVVPPIIQQTAKAAESLPALVNTATEQYQGLNDFIDRYELRPQVESALNSIKESSSSVAKSVGTNLISGIGSVFSLFTALALILVLAFLMLIEGPVWMKRIWGVYNDEDRMKYHRDVVSRMYSVVTGYVTGQLTVSAIAGTTAGIVVFILSFIFDVPANFAIPTAAIIFLLSLIPMFGALVGAILVSIVLVFNAIPAAIIFIVFFIIYQQIEGNFISPKIQSKRIDLSALGVLVSITIGLYLFGIAGGIISIPIAGCVKILIEEYFKRAKLNRIKSEKPLQKLIKKIEQEEIL